MCRRKRMIHDIHCTILVTITRDNKHSSNGPLDIIQNAVIYTTCIRMYALCCLQQGGISARSPSAMYRDSMGCHTPTYPKPFHSMPRRVAAITIGRGSNNADSSVRTLVSDLQKRMFVQLTNRLKGTWHPLSKLLYLSI
ncbi:hypothetical protein TNCV_1571921 [Trichonephila clavipes]|uniref:Uncharacterized protein n=1 Tax=Trichonephila clavipes TaxID=2585209 RepID=A0A8X6SVW3_TRICX|nr:hypothetical protein TNCV_1571921 [Trichonephila clavipes]